MIGNALISVYALQWDLEDSKKYNFFNNIFDVVRKSGEKEIIVISRDFSGHIGSNAKD